MPNIIIQMSMPDSFGPPPEPAPCGPSVEDQVHDALQEIESGRDSGVQWLMLNKLAKALRAQKKLNPRQQNVLDMIEPLLNKYGYHGTEAGDG